MILPSQEQHELARGSPPQYAARPWRSPSKNQREYGEDAKRALSLDCMQHYGGVIFDAEERKITKKPREQMEKNTFYSALACGMRQIPGVTNRIGQDCFAATMWRARWVFSTAVCYLPLQGSRTPRPRACCSDVFRRRTRPRHQTKQGFQGLQASTAPSTARCRDPARICKTTTTTATPASHQVRLAHTL